MNEPKPYIGNEEYLEDLIQTVRDYLGLYRRFCLLMDEDGRLLRRKGSVTFGTDLEFSLENDLSERERQEYEQEAEELREQIRRMGERGASSFRNHTAIPLEYLFQIFHLDEAERYLVILAAAPAFDRSLERAFGLFQDDYKKTAPDLDLAVRMYSADSRIRYAIRQRFHSEDSPLRYFFEAKEAEGSETLRLSSRILCLIWNYEEEDPFLAEEAFLELPSRKSESSGKRELFRKTKPSPETVCGEELLDQALQAAAAAKTPTVFYFFGPDGVGKRTLVRRMAERLSVPVLWVDLKKLIRKPELAEEKLLAVDREIRIRMAMACFIHFEALQTEDRDSEAEKGRKERLKGFLLRRIAGKQRLTCLISSKEWKEEWQEDAVWRLDFPLTVPETEQQILLWRELLTAHPTDGVGAEMLGTRYFLTPGQIAAALREAEAEARRKGKERPGEEELLAACRRRLTVNLGNQAVQVESLYTWEDLVLPDRQKKVLRQACDQIEFQHQVYGRWGFGKKVAYGRGVSMLFYGPPGTGKTMGAQVLANALKMELYKVNLSAVMSKYIGETEKNLEKIFDGVQNTRNILFFDEADALFGKRTEVKDSHDKYANAETAYLLQKMEEYPGIVILATNYMQNFDEAFKRRLKFMIEFPFPDAICRRQLWRQVFPREMPLGDVDYDYLAERFELSGSSIKNIAVAAAFLAAPKKRPVELSDLLTALRREMEKAGKSMPSESFGEYSDLLEPPARLT